MRIVSVSGDVAAVLSAADIRLLDRIVVPLAPLVKVGRLGHYRQMSAADFWWTIVGQVCVMGSARHWEKAQDSDEARRLLAYDAVRQEASVRRYLESKLKSLSATRFFPQAAKKLADAIALPALFDGARLTAFDGLTHRADPHVLRKELRRRWRTLGLKSASDLMISVGLSHDVVALDTRIIGFLEEYCGLDPSSHRIRSSSRHYHAVEQMLRGYCQERSLPLAKLDRVLFQFAGQSVVSLLARKPRLHLSLLEKRAAA